MLTIVAFMLAAQPSLEGQSPLEQKFESVAKTRGWSASDAPPQKDSPRCVLHKSLSSGQCSMTVEAYSFDRITDAYQFAQPYGRAEEKMVRLDSPALAGTSLRAYIPDYGEDHPSNMKARAGANMWITGTAMNSVIVIKTARARGVGVRVPPDSLARTYDDATFFATFLMRHFNSPYEPLRAEFDRQAALLHLAPNDQMVEPTWSSEKGYQEVLLSRVVDAPPYEVISLVSLVPDDRLRAQALRGLKITNAVQIPVETDSLRGTELVAVTYGRPLAGEGGDLTVGAYGLSGHCVVSNDLRLIRGRTPSGVKSSKTFTPEQALDAFLKLSAAVAKAAKDIPDTATGWN